MSEPQISKTPCDLGALDLLLCDKLADDARETLESHLDECAGCREHLERLAAEPEMWSEAHDALSSAHDTAEFAAWSASDGNSSAAPRSETDAARSDHRLAFLAPTDDPRMLGRFGGYEIAGVIGCGGMGVVMKGLDLALNRYVAIKVLAPHLATSAAARVRFAREARAAATVVHENVIAIHAVSEANGLPYLIMPYKRGTSLQKRIDAEGPFSVPEILRIGMQTAAGLAAAHAQGLVHRDIKPANILLEDGTERLTITDFGLARAADDASLTRSGVIAGTPQFMSPEQARGDTIDQRSDLFSLGSVLYMLCTGRAPFRAETTFGVLRRISDDVPRPIREANPEIPEWLAAAVEKLHAKDAAARFQSADEVAQLFEQCLAHIQQPTAVALPENLRISPAGHPAARTRLVRWLGMAFAVGFIIAAIGYALRDRPKDAAPSHGASKAAASLSDSDTGWDDRVTMQISELQNDIEDAEDDVDDFWNTTTRGRE